MRSLVSTRTAGRWPRLPHAVIAAAGRSKGPAHRPPLPRDLVRARRTDTKRKPYRACLEILAFKGDEPY